MLDFSGISVDKTACIIDGNVMTYQALFAYVSQIIHGFANVGVHDNPQRIGLMLPNSLALVGLYLATFHTGKSIIPFNRRYAVPEFIGVLEKAKIDWLILEASKLPLLEIIDLAHYGIKRVFIYGDHDTEYDSFSSLLAEAAPVYPLTFHDAATLLLFTSGSTGHPKGVVHHKQSIEGIVRSSREALDIQTQDITLIAEPLCHISGFLETFATLYHHGTAIILSTFDEADYVEHIKRYQPTVICTHIDLIRRLLDSGFCHKDTFTSLKTIAVGGDVISPKTQQQFIALTGKPIQLGYGMTEAIWLTLCKDGNKQNCIGKPVYDTKIKIINDAGEACQVGVAGEVLVQGTMLMSAYFEDPQATKDAFIDAWFKTGDYAYQDQDGYFWFTGRKKHIIIRNTSNIIPAEIENLLFQFSGIKNAIVIGVADDVEGEVPAAYMVCEDENNFNLDALKTFMEENIAAYKLPKYYYLLEAFPLTKTGKIDRQALRQLI